MAKKISESIKSVNDMLSDLKNQISIGSTKTIPDIITFVEDKQYLGLPHRTNPIKLYPVQKLVLKVFYRGSRGNEKLTLDPEDIELCKKLGLNSENNGKNGDLLEKYYSNAEFRELVLCWGRRSGKDYEISIIALYEAMRLLETPGGDPYLRYGIGSAVPISILTVASAKHQARIAFAEIRDKLLQSPYFSDKIGSLEENAIYLLTPADKKINTEQKEKGRPPMKGSVVIEVGNSNSDGLLGKGVFVLILDEVASYKNTKSSSSGDRILTGLGPALNTYGFNIPVLDKNGKQILNADGTSKIKRKLESKILAISSPRGKEGVFWDLYEKAYQVPDRIMCRLPTWDVAITQTEESLRETNTGMNEEQFQMEFGAEFSGTAGENFFDRDKVDACFNHPDLSNKSIGEAGKIYFAHLDPATSSHNYALVICHQEHKLNQETKQAELIVIVDHIKFWFPTAEHPISIEKVDEYVMGLKRRFYLGLVTYDAMNSAASIEKMKKAGLKAKETKYTRNYKMSIYKEIEHLVNSGRLYIPRGDEASNLLHDEMIHLQRRFDATGFKIFAPDEKTDDIIDALSGAAHSVISSSIDRFPRSRTVELSNPAAGQRMWQSMQGPIGFGNGRAVAANLEKRNSWPNWKR